MGKFTQGKQNRKMLQGLPKAKGMHARSFNHNFQDHFTSRLSNWSKTAKDKH